jgi:hypothetical protein
MADKNWQAGGGIMIPAGIVLCLVASVWAAVAYRCGIQPCRAISAADPKVIWDVLIGGLVVCCFLVAVGLWILSTLRRVKQSQLRRNAFVSSALNNLKPGRRDDRFAASGSFSCNDRYLEIYGLSRSDITPNMTGRGLLELRRSTACSTSASTSSMPRPATPRALSPSCRTGSRFWSNICIAERRFDRDA